MFPTAAPAWASFDNGEWANVSAPIILDMWDTISQSWVTSDFHYGELDTLFICIAEWEFPIIHYNAFVQQAQRFDKYDV